MAKILGIVTETHDSGIALLDDGMPLLVLEEERFNRQKHTLAFPRRALAAAFAELKLDIGDIDVITTPWEMRSFRRSAFSAVTGQLPASLNSTKRPSHASHPNRQYADGALVGTEMAFRNREAHS